MANTATGKASLFQSPRNSSASSLKHQHDELEHKTYFDDKHIVQEGSHILRQKSLPVKREEIHSVRLLWKRLDTTLQNVMKSHTFKNSAGISAVQVGTLQRVCLIWTPQGGYQYLANPRILAKSEKVSVEFEGCLSFFDKRGLVPRATSITISYLDFNFKHREEAFCDAAARIILHELDHMDGILYTDRMRPGDRLIGLAEYKKIRL